MKKETGIQIAKIVLKTVAAAGFISMAILAPNALQALDIFCTDKRRSYNPKYFINNAVNRLKRQGMIEFKKEDDKIFLRLTEKGEQKLLKYQLQEVVVKKPKRWDRKWRIVIFDIREQKKRLRNFLRQELVNLGFVRLQNSVWVYPYDCEEVIVMLKAYLKTGKDILYIIADKIENDKWLKKEFKLILILSIFFFLPL